MRNLTLLEVEPMSHYFHRVFSALYLNIADCRTATLKFQITWPLWPPSWLDHMWTFWDKNAHWPCEPKEGNGKNLTTFNLASHVYPLCSCSFPHIYNVDSTFNLSTIRAPNPLPVISNYHPNCVCQIRKQLSSNKTRPQHEICYNSSRWPPAAYQSVGVL